MRTFLVLVVCALGMGCASGPGGQATTPVATNVTGEVGGSQGSQQLGETNNSSVTLTPHIYNFIGVERGVYTRTPEGAESLEVTGPGATNLTVGAGTVFGITVQESSSRISSGGSSAGGVGGGGQ